MRWIRVVQGEERVLAGIVMRQDETGETRPSRPALNLACVSWAVHDEAVLQPARAPCSVALFDVVHKLPTHASKILSSFAARVVDSDA